jgi:probable phosphoglycerate mutase
MKVVLIPCAATEWRDEGRLLGRVEVPPSPEGERTAATWVDSLRPLNIELIYHSPDELATKTAKIVAKALGVKTKKLAELAEVDMGLWAGLTEDDLRKRYASAHHELTEAPLHVSPPDGEDLAAAEERLSTAVQRILKKNGMEAIALVERPLSLALTRRVLQGGQESQIWEAAQQISAPVVVETNGKSGASSG